MTEGAQGRALAREPVRMQLVALDLVAGVARVHDDRAVQRRVTRHFGVARPAGLVRDRPVRPFSRLYRRVGDGSLRDENDGPCMS